MLGNATLTTVLSSIAIASAKHIVSRTMTFSLALSPSKPSIRSPSVPSCRDAAFPGPTARAVVLFPSLGQFAVFADRQRDEDQEQARDPGDRLGDHARERVAGGHHA